MNPDRFWARVDTSGECWLWLGSRRPTGYGTVAIRNGPRTTAHRYAFTLNGGIIPPGYQVDHLCRNPRCVNPAHLEAVTPAENMYRTRREMCHRGHSFVQNGQGKRICPECLRATQRERRARKRAASPPPPLGTYQASKTHCPQGHPYDELNTYVTRDGKRRMCRECMRTRTRAWRAQNRNLVGGQS